MTLELLNDGFGAYREFISGLYRVYMVCIFLFGVYIGVMFFCRVCIRILYVYRVYIGLI